MSNDKKPYFPLFVDLNEKQIVVVGAGTIAKRRIRTLVSFTNVSHSLNDLLKQHLYIVSHHCECGVSKAH